VCLENEKDRSRLVGRVSDERKSAAKVPRDVLARYAGVYQIGGPLGDWTVSVDGDELKIEMATGGGKQPVVPLSDSVFTFPAIGGTVRFVTDAKGVASQLILTIVEGDIPGFRK
jgi:hypothetical protein